MLPGVMVDVGPCGARRVGSNRRTTRPAGPLGKRYARENSGFPGRFGSGRYRARTYDPQLVELVL